MFWCGVAMIALVVVPMSLFGFDPAAFPMRTASWLLGSGAVLMVLGAAAYLRGPGRDPARRKRAFLMFGAVALVALVAAGGTIALYAYWWDEGSLRCRRALEADALADRRAALADAEPYRAKIGFFNETFFFCEQAERELAALDRDGACPRFPPSDVECRCGAASFPADWPGPRDRARCDRFDASGSFVPELLLTER